MDYENLKKTVKKIELSDEMRARIIRNCTSKTLYETEETIMNKNKTNGWTKKTGAVAAAAVLCLCLTMTAGAAVYTGFFKDITDRDGTVTGTQYDQAANEIDVSVIPAQNEISVLAVMVNPNVAPYSEIEQFGIDRYQIVDLSGNVVVEGDRTDLSALANGEAEIVISLEGIAGGDYRLVIDAFVGGKKADQPLVINGKWECEFSM